MNWYEGDVTGAIKASKTSNAHLIVFTSGVDASSKLYQESLNKLTNLESKSYVALRIEANSVAHGQLEAIYGHIGIPSVLVINAQNGAAIECFSGPSFSKEKLLSLLPSKPMEEATTVGNAEVVRQNFSTALREERQESPPKLEVEKEKEQGSLHVDSNTMVSPSSSEPREKHLSARIQLKLDSGQSEVVTINAEETLAVVRTKASQIFELRGSFDLAIPYPRRIFLKEEDSRSVETLGLCPASTLLVLQKADASQLSAARFTNTLFLYLEPILAFFRNIWERFTGRAREPVAPKTRIMRMKSD